MKTSLIIFALLLLVSSKVFGGLPPTTTKGSGDSVDVTTFKLRMPNIPITHSGTIATVGTIPVAGGGTGLTSPGASGNQLVSDGSGLVSTEPSKIRSSYNLMTDGSFESGVTEGTCSGCTATQESTIVLATPRNTKALKLEFSASTGCYAVDKTTSAQYASVQGMAGVWISTDQAGVTFKTRRNGAATANIVNVEPSAIYQYYEIPDVTGTTSFGWEICATSSITGNVYADESFAGPAKVTASLNNISAWQSYTPTFTGFGTVTNLSAQWRQVGSNLELRFRFTAGTTTATIASASLPSGYTVLSSIPLLQNVGLGAYSQNTNSIPYALAEANSSVLFFGYGSGASGGLIKANGSSIQATGNTLSFFATVPVNELRATASTISSTNKNTDWEACTPNSYQGIGSPTGVNFRCKRSGSDLLMRGYLTSGTSTPSEVRIGLPVFRGVQLTSADSSIIPAIQLAGDMTQNVSAGTYFRSSVLIEPSVTYFTIGTQSNALNAGTKSTGTGGFTSSVLAYFTARIPIQGWDESNVIVASLANVPIVPNVTSPVVFTGVVQTPSTIASNPQGFFVSVSCSGGIHTVTMSGLASLDACIPVVKNTGTVLYREVSTTSTTLSYKTVDLSNAATCSTGLQTTFLCLGSK